MRALQKLLLLPCLAPFVMLIVLSALTRGTPVRLQLLIWRTPPLPIGAGTVLAASTGAGLAASTILLLKPSRPPLRRQVHRAVENVEREPQPPPSSPAMPERDIRDPAPTVAVSYRVIQQPERVSSQTTSSDASDWGQDPDRDW